MSQCINIYIPAPGPPRTNITVTFVLSKAGDAVAVVLAVVLEVVVVAPVPGAVMGFPTAALAAGEGSALGVTALLLSRCKACAILSMIAGIFDI
jgi:hypothetical protein